MRCARVVLAWALGVPLAAALGIGAILGWTFACLSVATALGLPEGVGAFASIALLTVALGAAIGISECREGR